jgi:hypothetical protein
MLEPDKLKQTATQAAENTAQLNMKVIDHAEENTRQAFNALRAAAKANGLSELMQVQADYVRDQGARSMAQVREIGELITNFGRSAMSGMTGGGEKKDG